MCETGKILLFVFDQIIQQDLKGNVSPGISDCRYNPCLNGGTYHSNGDGTNYCECAEGFQGTHCNEFQMFGLEYVVIKYDSKSWTDAQADCVQRGYNLTSVISLAESDLLKTFS